MSVVEVLVELGGTAFRRTLVAATSRVEVDRALATGEVVRLHRDRYALAIVDDALAAADRLGGVVSRTSAALHHGWAVQTVPERPHVTVPMHRRVGGRGAGAEVHYAALGADDIEGSATSKDRALVDCLRWESFDGALAIADSALREGFPRARLLALARDMGGPGAPQARSVAAAADGRAANPFESVLRGIASRVPGLLVTPQVSIHDPGFLGRPDLVDERLQIVIKADSFEWHGGRDDLVRDARRYNGLAVAGWLVLRFTWEDVMFHPLEVARVLAAAVRLREEVRCAGCRAA